MSNYLHRPSSLFPSSTNSYLIRLSYACQLEAMMSSLLKMSLEDELNAEEEELVDKIIADIEHIRDLIRKSIRGEDDD